MAPATPQLLWAEPVLAARRQDGRIPLFGNGEETRGPFVRDDAVDLILKVVSYGSTGVLNLATGASATFRAVAEMVAAHAGRPVEIAPSPRRAR